MIATSNIRQPVFSGSFYPERKEAILQQFEEFHEVAEGLESDLVLPKDCSNLRGIVVPHAGFIFSGQTAYLTHQLLAKCQPKKIALIGPSHRALFQGAVSDGHETWETPMGTTRIIKDYFFPVDTKVHDNEHSLEVQLPFIQYFDLDAVVLPLVIGNLPDALVSEYAEYLFQEKYFLIISTDLSHYHQLDETKIRDALSVDQIENLRSQNVEACGVNPLRIGFEFMKRAETHPHLIHYATSAAVFNDTESVVGYAGFWF